MEFAPGVEQSGADRRRRNLERPRRLLGAKSFELDEHEDGALLHDCQRPERSLEEGSLLRGGSRSGSGIGRGARRRDVRERREHAPESAGAPAVAHRKTDGDSAQPAAAVGAAVVRRGNPPGRFRNVA